MGAESWSRLVQSKKKHQMMMVTDFNNSNNKNNRQLHLRCQGLKVECPVQGQKLSAQGLVDNCPTN